MSAAPSSPDPVPRRRQRRALHTPPRILLALAEVRANAGGIENVGRSMIRLLAGKQREGAIDYRVASLRGPRDAGDARALEELTAGRLRHFADSRLRMTCYALRQMAFWADMAIFIHAGIASMLPLLPRVLRPISLTWIYGIEVWSPLIYRHRQALLACDHILGITEFTVRKARQVNPSLPPVRCCHLGIPMDCPAPPADLAAQLGFSPGRHDVLIVARVTKTEGQKGHDHLIRALKTVRAAVPDARLIVAGTGDNLDFHRELARCEGVEDAVRFTGFVADAVLAGLYERCGVFAMPSRQEGFGLVYLEAMKSGLPCVASNCDGAQEVVADGQTGILVDPDDSQALAGALIRLLTDETLRTRMGEAGRRRLDAYFTEEHFHRRLWEQIARALAGGAAPCEDQRLRE